MHIQTLEQIHFLYTIQLTDDTHCVSTTRKSLCISDFAQIKFFSNSGILHFFKRSSFISVIFFQASILQIFTLLCSLLMKRRTYKITDTLPLLPGRNVQPRSMWHINNQVFDNTVTITVRQIAAASRQPALNCKMFLNGKYLDLSFASKCCWF